MDNQNNQKQAQKKTSNWSLMDTVLLILLAAALLSLVGRIVYAYQKRNSGTTDGAESVRYVVDFTVDSIQREVLDSVNAFDAVYLYDGGAKIGNIGLEDNGDEQRTAFYSVSDADEESETTQGTVPPVQTGETAAKGSLVCKGILQDGSLFIEAADIYISPGSTLTVCTERTYFQIRIVRITAMETEE